MILQRSSVPRFDNLFMRTASFDVPAEGKSAFALEMDDVRDGWHMHDMEGGRPWHEDREHTLRSAITTTGSSGRLLTVASATLAELC